MTTKTAVSEAFYREVIDLNRYSNSVAGKYARAYNDIIIAASKRLIDIDFRQQKTTTLVAPETRKRLRAIIKQSKDSLNSWSGTSAKAFKKELQGLAVLQTEFIEEELKKVVASGDIPINSVAVSKDFGDAVVSTDPTKLNLFGRPEEEFKKFKAGDFALTTKRGELLTLPNGETVEKAFRGIAARQQESLARHIRQGVLSGETNVQIARRLMGRLNFNEYAKEGTRAFALAGNQPLKLANNQIKTIVRTSINQVSNAASQSVYAANKDVAPEYEYVATLDSKTSSICQRLDGQKFGYDKGPTPPQHFNCRSTTVPVVDYKKLGLTPPKETKLTTRPSETGRVPQKVSYGDWLYEQRARGANNKLKKYEPGEIQIQTLGFEKAKYFNRLAAKSNGKDALRQVIRSDGSEMTLEDLKRKYGKPSDIKAKVTAAAPKVTTPPVKPSPAIKKIDKEIAETKKQLQEAKAQLKALEERDPSLPTIAQLQGISPTGKVKANEVNKAFDLMDQMEGLAGENARKLRKFAEKKQVFCNWSNAKEGNLRSSKQKYEYFLDNPQFKKTIQTSLKNETTYGFSDVYRDMDAALKTNDFRFVSYEAKRYFTAGGKGRKYMNGMTIKGANHIVLKATSKQKAIKNLKKMQDDIKDAVKYAKNNQNNPNWDRNNYWSAHGKGRFDEGTSWLKTYVHEMGHQIHYTNEVNKLSSYDWIPSAYGSLNYKERFAETFVQFIFSPVELKKASPSAYKWIEDTLDASLKKVDKWT